MSLFDFNAAFDNSAPSHFEALGSELVTVSRPHSLIDARGSAVTSLRLAANASIGATSITLEPTAGGRIKGRLPLGMVLASGVTVAAELDIKDGMTSTTVQVVALTAALTAGTTWTLPAGAVWSNVQALPFEDSLKLTTFGQGTAGGDSARGYQSPKLGFPVATLPPGLILRQDDVVTWSRGKSKIVGRPKNLGDSIDVELEIPS
jgi:hypothetical protein